MFGRGEPVVDAGIQLVRRKRPEGYDYFLVNRGSSALDKWVTFDTPAKSAVLMDPRISDRTGVAKVQHFDGKLDKLLQLHKGTMEVYLQLQPGESCVLRTFTDKEVKGRPWQYLQSGGEAVSPNGTWHVRFTEGGPALPAAFESQKLVSWTTLGDAEAKRFAGTAVYTLEFDRPAGDAKQWQLDLGRVADSARVKLNGKSLGTLWCPPFKVNVGEDLRPGKNTLEVEVTNVAANRIADMDRRGVPWKIFRDANVLSVNGGNLDASKWPIREAGLLGPVTLVPLRDIKQFEKLGKEKT